jgi:hypothetical protein
VAGAGESGPAAPDLARRLPLVAQDLDLELLMSGGPDARWRRSRELAAGLAPLHELDPLEDSEAFVQAVGVMALVEGALAARLAAGGQPEGERWLELLRRYRSALGLEARLRRLAEAVEVASLAQAAQGEGARAYLGQLLELPAAARVGVRWLAAHPPSEQAAGEAQAELQAALLVVARREGDWTGLLSAARALGAAGAEAEALFELSRGQEAEAALVRARRAGASGPDLALAEGRRELLRARVQARRSPGAVAELELARRLLGLGEPWRLLERLTPGRVIEFGHPGLDEAYLQALRDSGRSLEESWAFAARARGQPAQPALLGARIGLGVRRLLALAATPGAGFEALRLEVLRRVRLDLAAYRAENAARADRLGLEVELLAALLSGDLGAAELRAAQAAFARDHPAELAGLRAGLLLAHIAPAPRPGPWSLARGFRQACFPAPLPAEAAPLLGAAAVSELLQGSGPAALREALEALRSPRGAATDPGLELWRAHLHAALGLGGTEAEKGSELQAAVDGYTRVLAAPDAELEARCDALAALGTLLFEQGSLEAARELLGRTEACHGDPSSLAVLAAVDLARGEPPAEGAPGAADFLARVLPGLGSVQARLQAQGWLAAAAEAAGDPARAKDARQAAGRLFDGERARGRALRLVPDRLAMLAPWNQVQLALWPDLEGPFGLRLEVRFQPRLTLFPPAALDEARLAPFLEAPRPSGG